MSVCDPLAETFIEILNDQPTDPSLQLILFGFLCALHFDIRSRFYLDISIRLHLDVDIGFDIGIPICLLSFLVCRRNLFVERFVEHVLIMR